MSKLMLLGGSHYLRPVIEAAHSLDCQVITCDYLPDNYAHRLSDRYCNISIVDREKVLREAEKLGIDGIMSFACDPGVLTAAYVAEEMGLPFQGPVRSVEILQDKGLFRQFLTENGFKSPHAKRYNDPKEPFGDLDYFTWPIIVKPVDSAGSKGVVRVDSVEELAHAIDVALEYSLSGGFIVEDFLTFTGYHSSSDPFTVDGELKFTTYSDQLFDSEADNPYTPAFIIWPSSMAAACQEELTAETQRLMRLLDMKTGIYNIESCVSSAGDPLLMEVSPRGGGCRIAEIQRYVFGVDLILNEVKKAIGLPVEGVYQAPCDGHWCEMIIHAAPGQSGILKRIAFDPEIERRYLKDVVLSANPGDEVLPFTGANMSLGDAFLRFDTREELDEVMKESRNWLKIELE